MSDKPAKELYVSVEVTIMDSTGYGARTVAQAKVTAEKASGLLKALDTAEKKMGDVLRSLHAMTEQEQETLKAEAAKAKSDFVAKAKEAGVEVPEGVEADTPF